MTKQAIKVPDMGGMKEVEIIEVCVAVGDDIAVNQALVVVESDKASMEIPSPLAGKITALKVSVGDKISAGDLLLDLEATSEPVVVAAPPPERNEVKVVADSKEIKAAAGANASIPEIKPPAPPLSSPDRSVAGSSPYAGPAVRLLARELGVDLNAVNGTGPKGRILKHDVQAYVKSRLAAIGNSAAAGSGIPPVPAVDFSQFGDIALEPLSRIQQLTAANMSRCWLNVPHVTQFDEVDITELEEFRASFKTEMEVRNIKLTLLPFLIKAAAGALKSHPKLNASLLADGKHLAYKKYVHIGIAVDTPAGLLVPVIRNADQKSIWQLAAEAADLAARAKERKLTVDEMQGACFTISSLGPIGGTGFTPIVNAPEVGILGVSRAAIKPVWNGSEFIPRKMLPLTLSYDHRVVNGADGGRFLTFLSELLADIRLMVL